MSDADLSDLRPPLAIISLVHDERSLAIIRKMNFDGLAGEKRPTCFVSSQPHVLLQTAATLSPDGNVLLIFDARVGDVSGYFSCCGTRKGPHLPEWARGKIRWGVGIGTKPMSESRVVSVAQNIGARFFKNFEDTVQRGMLPYGEKPMRTPSRNSFRRRSKVCYDPLETGYGLMGWEWN